MGDVAGPATVGDAGVRVVLVTAPAEDVAERLVSVLLDERLVACGTIVPGALSLYRWQGELTREREALIVLKTTATRIPLLLERLPALHPYEVPELLVLPVEAGHAPYLDWLNASVATTHGGC